MAEEIKPKVKDLSQPAGETNVSPDEGEMQEDELDEISGGTKESEATQMVSNLSKSINERNKNIIKNLIV